MDAAELDTGAFGNLIEWCDWTIYGLLAVVFAGQIVPADNPGTSLIGLLLATRSAL